MGIQEQEFIELFREMKRERHGAPISDDGVTMLTVARIIKRVLEKCTIEISGSIDGLKTPNEYAMTYHQANAILDMDCIAYSEGQGPDTDEATEGWRQMLGLAKLITGKETPWRP